MEDEKGLYIVPMNFGYEFQDGKPTLFFHSAKEGRKINALRNRPEVAVEMDGGHHLEEGAVACDYAFGFQSIIGTGTAEFVDDPEEKKRLLTRLMEHQTGKTFRFDDAMAETVCVFKIIVSAFSAKHHL